MSRLASAQFAALFVVAASLAAGCTEDGPEPTVEAIDFQPADFAPPKKDGAPPSHPLSPPEARDLRVECVDDTLAVRLTTRGKVEFAWAQLCNGFDCEAVELAAPAPLPVFSESGELLGFSQDELVRGGVIKLDESSELSCATAADAGVRVEVLFEDGHKACVFGGNLDQLPNFICS